MNEAGNSQDNRAKAVPVTYFVRAGDAIKIGSANDFKSRLRALQTAREAPLEVLAVVPSSAADEFQTHQRFAHLRLKGEWFKAAPELLSFIEGLKGAPTTAAHIDVEMDYLGKLVARCRSRWPKDPKINTLAAQLANWNRGGNRIELRKMIPRTIEAIMADHQ